MLTSLDADSRQGAEQERHLDRRLLRLRPQQEPERPATTAAGAADETQQSPELVAAERSSPSSPSRIASTTSPRKAGPDWNEPGLQGGQPAVRDLQRDAGVAGRRGQAARDEADGQADA